MSKDKVWKFKCKDAVKITTAHDELVGKAVDSRTAANPPSGRYVITHPKEDKEHCYIYTDTKTDLELVSENVRLGE